MLEITMFYFGFHRHTHAGSHGIGFLKRSSASPCPSGLEAWFTSVRSHVRVSVGPTLAGCPGRYLKVPRCAGLSLATFETERPLGIVREEKGTSSRVWVSAWLRYDLKC